MTHPREPRAFEPAFEELILTAALDPTALDEDQRARLSSSPALAERVKELRADLAGLRAVLAPAASAEGDQDLVQRVLAATTREDLGWRGELRLLRGFVRSRWRASVLVRVVAASLLIHIAALPLLAYFGYFAPREPGAFFTGIEPPPLPPQPLPEEELADLQAPDGDSATIELVEVAREEALSWARYHLERGAPDVSPDQARSSLTRVLAQRSGFLAGKAFAPHDLPGPEAEAPVAALVVELLLDRHVLGDREPADLAPRLEDLVRRARTPRELAPGEQLLVAATLARAHAYGLLLPAQREALEHLAAELEGGSHASLAQVLLGPSTSRPGAPLDVSWLAALDLAGGTLLTEDPVGLAWRAWTPR